MRPQRLRGVFARDELAEPSFRDLYVSSEVDRAHCGVCRLLLRRRLYEQRWWIPKPTGGSVQHTSQIPNSNFRVGYSFAIGPTVSINGVQRLDFTKLLPAQYTWTAVRRTVYWDEGAVSKHHTACRCSVRCYNHPSFFAAPVLKTRADVAFRRAYDWRAIDGGLLSRLTNDRRAKVGKSFTLTYLSLVVIVVYLSLTSTSLRSKVIRCCLS